jgi:hypothetical protein
MKSGSLTILFVALGVGIPLFVAAILLLVFGTIRRTIARQRAALEHEGIVLDSGIVWVTIRYSGFRAQGFARGVGLDKTRGSLILSRQRLVLVPSRWQFHSIDRSDFRRFTVGIAEDGTLHLHSDDPPNATGSIDFRVPVTDAGEWVRTLTAAGARHHAG